MPRLASVLSGSHSVLTSFDSDAPRCSALSRSAQFWSSYSGYLREMRACSPDICVICYLSTVVILAQLCYAFRRWNEIGLSPCSRPWGHGFVAKALFCARLRQTWRKIFIKTQPWKTSTLYKFFLRVKDNSTTLWAIGKEIFRQATRL